MKSTHPTDGFLSSESAYLEAAQYWMHLFQASGGLPPRGWQVTGVNRLLDGSCDTGSGVLLTLVNTSVLKVLRLSQSHRTETAFLIAHLEKREVSGAECTQLSIHCSPNQRIEGIIILLALAWTSDACTADTMEAVLSRLLPDDVIEFGEAE